MEVTKGGRVEDPANTKRRCREMELTKEQMAAVQVQVLLISLQMAHYNSYGEDAFKVAKEWAAQTGKMMGENIKRNLNITGTDTSAVAAVLNAFLMEFGFLALCRVEGNKVIAEIEGFCPVMEAVIMLNAPWDKIDLYCAWPMFAEIARAVSPNAKLEILETRHRGDKSCKHVFAVP